MHRITTRTASTLAVLVTLAAATACGSAGSTAKQPPATRRPASVNPSTPAAISTATCDTGAWQSAPLAGQERDTARGATLLTAVRAAQHPECGYDRIVLDIAGPAARLQDPVRQQGAGRPFRPADQTSRQPLLADYTASRGHAHQCRCSDDDRCCTRARLPDAGRLGASGRLREICDHRCRPQRRNQNPRRRTRRRSTSTSRADPAARVHHHSGVRASGARRPPAAVSD